jgi:flagellar protein FliJ
VNCELILGGGSVQSTYKFRLQKLLDIRVDFEEKSKIEFKQAVNDLENSELKLRNLQECLKKHNCYSINETTIERKMKFKYINAVDENIENVNIEIDDKKKIVEDKRNNLKKRQIDRKMVEVIKDKQQQKFIIEQNLIEQKNNDEFALYGHIRRKLKGGEI